MHGDRSDILTAQSKRDFLLGKIIEAYSACKKCEFDIYISHQDIQNFFLDSEKMKALQERKDYSGEYRYNHDVYTLTSADDTIENFFIELMNQGLVDGYRYQYNYGSSQPLHKDDMAMDNYIGAIGRDLNGWEPSWGKYSGGDTGTFMGELLTQEYRGIYITNEMLVFHVGYFTVKVPEDFGLRLIKARYGDLGNVYQVSENCFVDILNEIIIGNKGVKRIRRFFGKRKTGYFELLENLIKSEVSENKKEVADAEKIIVSCTREQHKELERYFSAVTDEQVTSYSEERIHFVYNKVRLIAEK